MLTYDYMPNKSLDTFIFGISSFFKNIPLICSIFFYYICPKNIFEVHKTTFFNTIEIKYLVH